MTKFLVTVDVQLVIEADTHELAIAEVFKRIDEGFMHIDSVNELKPIGG